MSTIDRGESRASPSPDDVPNFSRALTQWSGVLGPERVLTDSETLDRFSRSTLPTSTRPRAVLRPLSTDEVRQVVLIAAAHRVALYPISRGKNWGYGDACAPTDGQVIVDLSGMNRILEVNETLAYAVIEPGVSQQQMCDYLREKGYKLWLDVTGAGPDASIVGNTLQRGFGHTPYGDHFAHTCGMEVVLADGCVLKTGFGGYENAKATRVFPWGIGPWLDGLFTQSHLGIVTQMGIWLLPAPEVCEAFAFKVDRDADVERIVESLRPLRMHEIVRSTVHIANDLRVLSARRQYPWDLTGGATPLPADVRQQLRREAGLGAWNVMGGLYGNKGTVAAARQIVRRQLRHLGHVHFFGPRRLCMGLRLASLAERLGIARQFAETVRSAESVYQLLTGVPSLEHLKGVFWRSRRPPDPSNPNPGDAGVIWLSPVLPMTAAACREVLETVEPVFREYRFEPLITMTSITSRALVCIMSICYDKDDINEARLAGECYERLFDRITTQGYLPYRCGVQSMARIATPAASLWDLAKKHAFRSD